MPGFKDNQLCSLLGIDLPIIGAPMFLVSYPELVAAVSNAGGLGSFPAANYRTIPELREGLAEIRRLTDKPIGVNILLHEGHNPRWREQFDASLEQKAELIIFSLGVKRNIVKEAQAAGAKVFFDVTTPRHARIAAASGVDGIIAVTQGAGGHAGTINPFSLVNQLQSQYELPILAAGSISNGRQMAAALSLGAAGVYLGTRLVASTEAAADQDYKDMIVKTSSEEIVYSAEISGIPANWLKASYDQWKSSQEEASSLDEYKRWRDIWSAGQGVAQISEVQPVATIMEEMISEFKATAAQLSSFSS